MTATCKTCGKPPLANRAGSVTSYFFQHNYCQCHNKNETEEQESLPSTRPSQVSGDAVCSNCGKSRPTNRRAGSFTAFLFKELRCTCAGPSSKPAQKDKGQATPGRVRRPAARSRTAARVAQRKQFTESYRESKVSVETTSGSAFQPGAVIGGAFRIDSMIGRGGMGVVYLAEQMSLRKHVALKILAPELVNEQSWRRFQAEAKILAPLNHSSLVKVYDLGIHDQTIPYYSMDFLEGQSIEEILTEDGPLSLRQTIAVFVEVLDGLAYAHRHGIVHRDIKPGNIMVCTVNGAKVAKILDFGISKLVGENAASSQSLTAVGEIFGSPFYMSPEQCAGTTVDARSDIYSVGCTLIEALTGFVPFEGDGFLETVLMHQEEEAPQLRDLDPDLNYPDSLDQVLAKCLAKRPIDRYQSAKEMSLDLVRVLEGKTVSAQLERPRYNSVTESNTRRPGKNRSSARSTDTPAPSHFLPISLAVCAILALTGFFAFMILGPTDKIAGLSRRSKASTAEASVDLSTAIPPSRPTSSTEVDTANTKAAVDGSVDNVFAPVEDTSGVYVDPRASKKETAMFSTIVEVDGQRLRRFVFPTDTVIGNISYSDGAGLQAASGVIDLEADKSLTFVPEEMVGRFPQYMKRFQAGDVKLVVVPSNASNDSVLAAISTIPGVSDIHINGTSGLTAKGFESLAKLKQLDGLVLSSTGLDGSDLASADFWPQIKKLTLRDIVQPGPLLRKLQSSRHLAALSLTAPSLSHEDFLLISKMTSLKSLSLPSNVMTIEDLAVITTLPNVATLDIRGCGLGSRVIPVLAKMTNLRELKILQAFSPTELKTKLINQLPRVRVYSWSDIN